MDRIKRNELIKEDYENGLSNSELCVKYNLHRSTIQKILKSSNTKLHKNKSFIKCDKDFFKKYTNESCYWAGFILADGCIRKDRNSLQIKLAKKDKNHLFKFLKSISCKEYNRVKEYDNYVQLTISLDEFKRNLMSNFDIYPQKTYTAKISQKIPENKLSHFIRGYVDGDGCITKTSTSTLSIVGTKEVLDKITIFFYEKYSIRLKSKNKVPPINNFKKNVGQISYSGKNAFTILNNLYKNSIEDIYLERKFKKYTELNQL